MAKQTERVLLFILNLVFCVFLFAGVFEDIKFLSFLPIDLTILAGLLVIGLLTIFLIAYPHLHVTKPAIFTVLLLIGLVIYITVSFLWADFNDGQGRLFRLSTGGLITIVYPLLAIGTKQWRQKQFLMVLAVAGGVFAVSIFAAQGTPNWAPHYIAVARPTGICGVIGFATLATSNSLSRAAVALAVAIGCVLMIFISGSRGPFIALLLSFAFIWTIVYITPSDNSQIIGRLISSPSLNTSILAASPFVFLIVVTKSTILPVESVGNASRFFTLLRGGGASASKRIQIYQDGIEMWLDTPASIFFGHGIGSFSSRYGGYPHNIFLELLVTGGLFALLWFVIAILWSARGTVSRKESPSFQLIAGLALVVYMLVNAQVTGDLYINRYLFVFIGFIPLIKPPTCTPN